MVKSWLLGFAFSKVFFIIDMYLFILKFIFYLIIKLSFFCDLCIRFGIGDKEY